MAEEDDERAAYAACEDDLQCMHKAALLGDVDEARRIAGEHPRLLPPSGTPEGDKPADDAPPKTQPSYFERRDDRNGMTPLIIASAKGHLAFVKFLIEEEEVERQRASEPKQMTPFFAACSNGRLEVAKYLASKVQRTLCLFARSRRL